MGRGDNKTLLNRILGTLRRGWSFPQIRIGVVAIIIITIFLCVLYNGEGDEKYLSIYSKPLYSERQKRSNNDIACLIVADSFFMEGQATDDDHRAGILDLFLALRVYDRFLHKSCDLKVFFINETLEDYVYEQDQARARIPNMDITYIPKTQDSLHISRRMNNYHIFTYTYKFYSEYKWYIKFPSTECLVFVDHFRKLITDPKTGDNIYDMDKPQLLGHFMKHLKDCQDFIYSDAVYAFNNEFLKRVGKVATSHIIKNELQLENIKECVTYPKCKHHENNDFSPFCLHDLGVDIKPTRDSQEREYFLPWGIHQHYVSMEYEKHGLYDMYWRGKDENAFGENCCAKYPVSFCNYPNSGELSKYYQVLLKTDPERRNMELIAQIPKFDDSPVDNLDPEQLEREELQQLIDAQIEENQDKQQEKK